MVSVVAVLTAQHKGRHRRHGEHDFWRFMGPEYAAKLFAGVRRHLTLPHELFLVTDTPEATPAGVTCLANPLSAKESPGWWSKLGLFAPGLLPDRTTLFLDLDNVVCGSIDLMFHIDVKRLAMIDDKVYPRLPNGSTMLFSPGECVHLFEEYVADPLATQRRFARWPNASDQAFIAAHLGVPVPLLDDYLPTGFFCNSRIELERGCDWSAASVVYGSWKPKPHESTHPFYTQHWRL
jgi:hypothetical protein